MTKLHRLLFTIWKLKMRCKGLKRGRIVETFSQEKSSPIQGTITSLTGDSITDRKYAFGVQVRFFEPLEGYDSRYFSAGCYSEKDIEDSFILL